MFLFSENEVNDREETEKMIHESDVSQIEIDLSKVTNNKPKKVMNQMELRYRIDLHKNGGKGTLSMPHDMRYKLNSKLTRFDDDPIVYTTIFE